MRGFRYFLVALFLTLFVSASANFARAQQQVTLGNATVLLTGPWKFHIGDNPQWADPNYDDSQWETVKFPSKSETPSDPGGFFGKDVPGWTAKGHPDYWGYAWYRIRVRVSTLPGEKLALSGPSDVNNGYEIFVNGMLLGSFGKFSGHKKNPIVYNVPGSKMFLLPQPEAHSADSTVPTTYTLAFRVWMDPSSLMYGRDLGGLRSPPLLGNASAVAAHVQSVRQEWIRYFAVQPIEAALFLLLAIVACGLVLFDRSDPVYLWLAAVLFITALDRANQAISHWTLLEGRLADHLIQAVLLGTLVLAGWVMVWWVWFRLRHPAWIPKTIAGLTLLYMICQALEANYFFTIVSHSVSAVFYIGALIVSLIFGLFLILIAVLGIRQQGGEGWLALPAIALFGIGRFVGDLHVFRAHITFWYPFGIEVTLADLNYLALPAVISALLLRRLLLSVRRQRETALEIEQAREVQQMLIPVTPPDTSGFAVESVYLPAQKVGGDFFQILPGDDGSLLIVVGDVSGKGLKAAMTVSTIVGALRGCALRGPADVLAYLNRVLYGQVSGFVTCSAALIASDGAMTIANAGHLSPYRNGEEMVVASGLPLGILAEGSYEETHYQLAPGDRLTFVSDGVVEATNAKRELFGFERTRGISNQPARTIAEAAKTFGQEDDISVVTVTRSLEAMHAV